MEEAWSLNKLSDMWAQIELPMEWPILELQHPTEEDWKPCLHPHVLSEIARGFHLLGGRGFTKVVFHLSQLETA